MVGQILRYIAIKYSVRGRDLGSTVEEAIQKVTTKVKLPSGYTIDWAGEYESQKRPQRRLLLVLPITILVIFVILYGMFKPEKRGAFILTNVAMASYRWVACLIPYPYKLQCFLWRGFSRASSVFRCRLASSWWNISINFVPKGTPSRRLRWKERSCGLDRL